MIEDIIKFLKPFQEFFAAKFKQQDQEAIDTLMVLTYITFT